MRAGLTEEAMRGERDREELRDAWLTLALVWLLLLTQPWVATRVAVPVATFVCFACATAVVLISMPALSPSRGGAKALALGLLAGLALRTALGAASPPPHAGEDRGWMVLASRIALAPVFEELLYRQRLLSPLRRRVGTAGAVAITSALFALPHLSPRLVAQSFVLGIGLGTARVRSGSVALCVGLHSGWNLAAG